MGYRKDLESADAWRRMSTPCHHPLPPALYSRARAETLVRCGVDNTSPAVPIIEFGANPLEAHGYGGRTKRSRAGGIANAA